MAVDVVVVVIKQYSYQPCQCTNFGAKLPGNLIIVHVQLNEALQRGNTGWDGMAKLVVVQGDFLELRTGHQGTN